MAMLMVIQKDFVDFKKRCVEEMDALRVENARLKKTLDGKETVSP